MLVSGTGERGRLRIRLVDVATWRTETPTEVAGRERIGRWHPAVADLRSSGRLDRISKEHQRRAMLLLHCLAKEAEARGFTVECVKSATDSGRYAQRETSKGLLRLTTPDGGSCDIGIKQYLDRTKHVPTRQETEDTERRGWRHYRTYDDTPSERLALVTYGAAGHDKEWGDTKKRLCAEEKLGDVLAAISRSAMTEARRAEERRIAEEERAERIERENAQARAAYVEHATGERLKRDAAAWEDAERLRRYLAAMRSRAADLVDDDGRAAADEWIRWCERYVDETVDPLGAPIRRPEVPEPSGQEIEAFRQRLGFGRTSWY
ncbi:MAG: hypothetical protein QM809_17140 [Gordonia sp. (in: high G+C Gram-positive bacteria)]|uniref:hypothetical protein n=1 Tax=Gordonia sp. (in: high G+C Gram-positive bacteria) TaxID=84139 RepID=UPI0039E292BB